MLPHPRSLASLVLVSALSACADDPSRRLPHDLGLETGPDASADLGQADAEPIDPPGADASAGQPDASGCGDGSCAAGEACDTCAADCGACSAPATFAFTTAGDHGAEAETDAVLDLVPQHGDFFLSLGDLSYGTIAPEVAWCDYVKAHVGADYPFEILSGNHESTGTAGAGVIDHFVAADCLPDRLPGVTGTYGKQYAFDYPATAPLVRVIAISPGLSFADGGAFAYGAGSARYQWTAARIDEARAAGIPWVIVASHLNCITTGIKTCEIGEDLFNLLIERKVDLILQAHDHTYQRSKQLAHGTGCAAIAANAYDPDCVADDGLDGAYGRGAGSVLVVSGMGGRAGYGVEAADPEAAYFAAADGGTHGLVRISGSATQLDVAFIPAAGGAFTDAFTIAAP